MIVGSGPAGVNAAEPLVKSGLKVAIVDSQLGNLKISGNTKVVQRLGKGGFSEVWFGISDFFTTDELKISGLPVSQIKNEYKHLAKRFSLKSTKHKNLYFLPVINNYRSSKIVDSFTKYKNFTYLPKHTVLKFRDNNKLVELQTKKGKLYSKYLILAAGAINTTRIVLQSIKTSRALYLTKPNYILVCLNIGRKFGINQQGYLNQDTEANSRLRYFIQFYKPFAYKPLLFKLFGALVIADIRFPAFLSESKYLQLKNKAFSVHVTNSPEEIIAQKKEVSNIKKMLFSLGLIPLITLTNRVSSHYAGGVETDIEGKLDDFKRVYVADSASWKALPAKPITLTIMANAVRVGKEVLKNF